MFDFDNVSRAIHANTVMMAQLIELVRQLNENVQTLNATIQKQVDPKSKK